MVPMSVLWLPIVVSAVVVFIASALAWTVMPHHKKEFGGLPNEDEILEALGKQRPSPGQYAFPFCEDRAEMGSPEMVEKYEKGPVGMVTVWPSGVPKMGKSMLLSMLYYLVVSFMVAYVASRTLTVGAHYLAVFRIAGTFAIFTYVGALFPRSIWFGRPWSSTFKEFADGVVYGLLTAGVFGWLWPN